MDRRSQGREHQSGLKRKNTIFESRNDDMRANDPAGGALRRLGADWRASPAQAQDQSRAYPNRPIKVIVPFPPGGPTDGMARIISERLGAVLGQSIVVENRGGGAGGSIGAKAVARRPDGYTILMTPGGSLTTGPAVHKNFGYDPLKEFTPVALIERRNTSRASRCR